MHLITLFRVMNPHQRCLQAEVKTRFEPKQVMPKSKDLSRSIEMKLIWTFDTEFSISISSIVLTKATIVNLSSSVNTIKRFCIRCGTRCSERVSIPCFTRDTCHR